MKGRQILALAAPVVGALSPEAGSPRRE